MVLGRSFTVLVLETTQKLRNEKGVDLKGEENGGSTTVIMHSRECIVRTLESAGLSVPNYNKILLSQNTSTESFMMQ
jgi:hypothetical protein